MRCVPAEEVVYQGVHRVRYFEGDAPGEATHLVARVDEPPAPGVTLALTEPHGDYALWTRPPG